jgi:hypothetical protein
VAERQEIEIVIGPDGQLTLETRGLAGGACLEETRELEAAVGTVRRREATPERWRAATAGRSTTRRR